MTAKIAALIVLYHPDANRLDTLIQRMTFQVEVIILADNSGSPIVFKNPLPANCTYIDMKQNAGIAAAQNSGIKKAIELQCSHVLLLDQDSLPAVNMVIELLTELQNLLMQKIQVVAVGPILSNMPSKMAKNTAHNIPVQKMIASGMLIFLATVANIGMMEEQLFIDDVDTEWCYRAISKSYKLFLISSAHMEHALGTRKKILFNLRSIAIHSPFRYYFIFRNHLLLMQRSYIPWHEKITMMNHMLKLAIKIIFTDEKTSYIKNMLQGIRDGMGTPA